MPVPVAIHENDVEYVAVDASSEITGLGETKANALAALAVNLGADEAVHDAVAEGPLRALAADVRDRFDDADVDQHDLEAAITWARSG